MGPRLADFLRRSYWPIARRKHDAAARRRLVDAVELFTRVLGRSASVDDLTSENYATFRAALEGQKTSRHSAYRHAFQCLWEFAWRTGLAPEGPTPDPPRRRKQRPGPLELARVAEWTPGRRILMPPAAPGTLRHFYDAIYRPERLLQSPRSTHDSYRSALIALYKWAERDIELGELTDALVAEYFGALLKAGLTAWSINRHRQHLFVLWRDAAERGLVAKPPTVRKLRITRNAPDAFTVGELEIVIAAAERHRRGRFIKGIPAGALLRAIILVMYYTALRRRAVCELLRADVDLTSGRLTARGSAMKNRTGKRFVLPPVAVEAVRAIWEPPRERLFPLSPPWLTRQLRGVFDSTGLARSVHRAGHSHKIRRTAATHARIAGGMVDACELLGHSAEYVTKLYIDESQLPDKRTALNMPVVGAREGPSDAMLGEARRLLADGNRELAAMAARIPLERQIAARCRDVAGTKPPGIVAKVKLLARGGLVTADESRLLCRAARTANSAAHGRPVDATAVAELLQVVAQFFISSP